MQETPAVHGCLLDFTVDLQHAVIAAVGDEDRPARADVDAVGLAQLGLLGRAAEPGGPLPAVAGEADDGAVAGAILADQVVLGVGDEDVTGGVDAEVLRAVEGGAAGVAAVAGGAGLAGAGDGPDRAGRVNDPQGMAAPL